MFREEKPQAIAFKNDYSQEWHNPLLVGCSGGGGHNAAIDAVKQYLQETHVIPEEDASLVKHNAGFPTDEGKLGSKEQRLINLGTTLMSDTPGLRNVARWGVKKAARRLKKTPPPKLPTSSEIEKEVGALSKSQLETALSQSGDSIVRAKQRFYIDMLLDVYPAGYQSAAIWNVLQRKDDTRGLTNLIELQSKSDKDNYKTVYNHFSGLLEDAYHENKKPYTEIISTQAMALPALCDAVTAYNQKYAGFAPEVKIHQYMTDMPTKGAVHFFNSLNGLNEKQRDQMYLYGVNLDPHIIDHFGLNNPKFAGVFSLDPENNPMVRKTFRHIDRDFDNTLKTTLEVKETGDKVSRHDIEPTEKMAAVMLGSQASLDTIAYVEKLAEHQFDKIFVFGGQAPHIKEKLQPLIERFPGKIIALANQDHPQIAPIMKRSDLVVMRGGGLSVMEQMALPHKEGQVILIHTKEEEGKLTSGISWEDANVDKLADHLGKKGIKVERTTVEKIDEQLSNQMQSKQKKSLASDELQCLLDPLNKDKAIDAVTKENLVRTINLVHFAEQQYNSGQGKNILAIQASVKESLDNINIQIGKQTEDQFIEVRELNAGGLKDRASKILETRMQNLNALTNKSLAIVNSLATMREKKPAQDDKKQATWVPYTKRNT